MKWLACVLVLGATPALAQPMLRAELLRRYDAPEANQGVAVDAGSIYAVGNSEIGRYDRKTGRKTGAWSGDPKVFPHLNSCAAIAAELVCASSNYPATPMLSTVEVFDRARLTHIRSIPLGHQAGSLTWVVKQGGAWWAGFANYDGHGGERGRDHTASALVKFDAAWKPLAQWRFPRSVLDRFAPNSTSGGVWGDDGLLYVTGHDAGELYVLRAPEGGGVLEHVATIAAPIEGQAIGLGANRTLFGIRRSSRQVVALRLPAVRTPK
ncbi:MAG: hypothetical protein JWQ29_3327 [Phenylobacterium sp.]|nr:hypothetical protein [Phenylobacterium sp.]